MTSPTHIDPAVLSARLCSVRTVTSHDGLRSYELTPVILMERTEAIADRIAEICNEPLVHGMLFAELLGGRRYEPADAALFLSWAEAGWEEGTHFVYLLLDGGAAVAGAIDIKSPTTESAEIGYWLSAGHSGVMTAAVGALCEIARDAGYRELHALVRPENERSARVLARAGFARGQTVERNGRSYDRYGRSLE